jgi:hypothetical protein
LILPLSVTDAVAAAAVNENTRVIPIRCHPGSILCSTQVVSM